MSSTGINSRELSGERILIVEDDSSMLLALSDCLADEGYRTLTARDGEAGLERILDEKPDLAIVDVMMPRMDGFELCRRVRESDVDLPILMLTARGEVTDRVGGLDAGADDYLVKPCEAVELKARVRALLRRFGRSGTDAARNLPKKEIWLGQLQVNFRERTASVPLTPKEFAMLEVLVRHAGEVISRARFLDIVWGFHSFPTTRTVDNHIRLLRAKIEDDPKSPQHIVTVHGTGYRLEKTAIRE